MIIILRVEGNWEFGEDNSILLKYYLKRIITKLQKRINL